MTHRKHAAALLTAVLLLALTACGRRPPPHPIPHRRLRPRPLRRPSSPPRPRHRRPPPEKTPAATAGRPKFERSLLEDYGVTPDHYEDLGNGIYQVYVKIDGKVVPYVTVDSATGDYHG